MVYQRRWGQFLVEEVVGGSLSGSLGLGHVASWHSSGQNSDLVEEIPLPVRNKP